MPLAIRLVIVLFVSILVGCAGPFAKRPATSDPLAIEAENRARTGDYQGAVQLFRQLADTTAYPDYYRLQAADAALRAGSGVQAQRLADAVNPRELESVDRSQHTLLEARLDLNAGRGREAMARLDTLNPAQLQGGQAIHYHTLRASAFNQLGDMLESARERVIVGHVLDQPDAIQHNNQAIYDALGRLPDKVLAEMQPPTEQTLAGWMELTRILKATPSGAASQALSDWRARFPGHPADGVFLNSALQDTGRQVQITPLGQGTATGPAPATPPPSAPPPEHKPFIGVLLPLSGPYSGAAQAIRTGMVAAYYADTDPGKLELRFVDSQSGDVAEQYRKLVAEGAKYVIGPLTKERVAVMAQQADLPVPVLGLNRVSGAANDRLYQFGLTPEDEVEQAAGSAWFDNRQNALVLAPANSFGQRMLKHFTAYWKKIGGKIVAARTYPHHGTDFAGPVKELVAAAGTPTTEAAVLPTPVADFVFLIADARDARQIMPQFAVQQTGQIPVYATSHVYSGRQDAPGNQDLNGLTFCDIPWLLNPDENSALSARALDAQVQQTPADYVKLIALGIDAYRLRPELEQMRGDPGFHFPGATGTLSLQAGNRVQRQLECAQFDGGVPRSRGPAPVLQQASP